MRRPPLSATFSPSVSFPFSFKSGVALYSEYCLATQLVRSSKALASASVHQLSRLPLASKRPPSSSNPCVSSCPMTAPMAAEVNGLVELAVVERRLQNAGGEVDVVHLRIVIGVYGGRRHVPFFLVDRLADLCDLPLELERVRPERIADRVTLLDIQTRVVAPLLRESRSCSRSRVASPERASWSPASSSRAD